MTLPQAVFFDLDNTLVHRNDSIDLYVTPFSSGAISATPSPPAGQSGWQR